MKAKVVVIGGSGLIGSKVVEKLKQQGHCAVAAPPDMDVYTRSGEDSAGALSGAKVVVDVAYAPSFEDQAWSQFFDTVGENLAVAEVADAINFFRTACENLAAAELAAGVEHHVALSVVGTDRLQDSAYFRAKLAQENLIKGSAIPYTIVRATPTFEFLRAIALSGTDGDTVRVSHSLFQPMAAEDVANVVADLALEAPKNGTVETAGPDVFYIDELVAEVLEFDKDPRDVAIGDPGALYFGLKVNNESLMPGPHARLGPTRFDSWLSQNPSPLSD